MLRPHFHTDYDGGVIGKRYRRQDEIGTPYCVTIDPANLPDHSVTARSAGFHGTDSSSIKDLLSVLRAWLSGIAWAVLKEKETSLPMISQKAGFANNKLA